MGFEFFALLDNTVHTLSYTLHLFLETGSLFFLVHGGLELGFETLELLLLAGSGGLDEVE